jgi:hypothetical protein
VASARPPAECAVGARGLNPRPSSPKASLISEGMASEAFRDILGSEVAALNPSACVVAAAAAAAAAVAAAGVKREESEVVDKSVEQASGPALRRRKLTARVPLTGEWSTPFVMRMRASSGSTRACSRVRVRVRVRVGVEVGVGLGFGSGSGAGLGFAARAPAAPRCAARAGR